MKLANGHQPFTYTLLVLAGLIVISELIFSYDPGLFLMLIFVTFSLLVFVLFFHRDPDREVPPLPTEYVLSPADGKVHALFQSDEESSIQIRMSVLNVHVNRMPITGIVKDIRDQSGRHWPFFSFLQRGTDENARKIITIESQHGDFELVQISGFLARRCVFYHSRGARINRGEKIGMIRFGSEVDLTFRLGKNDLEWLVKKGHSVKAGLTPIARIRRTVTNDDATQESITDIPE